MEDDQKPKDKPKFEAGTTPGMLKNPFANSPSSPTAPATPHFGNKRSGLQTKIIAGKTPGMLKNPFAKNRQKIDKRRDFLKQNSPAIAPQKKKERVVVAPQEPFWYFSTKYMFENAQKEKNLTDDQMEWIKKVAQLMPSILVKVPHFDMVSPEDVEMAILLETEENVRRIVETGAADFDPERTWNKTFFMLMPKHRKEFWITIATRVLEKLQS
jgi:hypothetical protein